MQKTALESHTASYADPIVVKAGDAMRLTGESERWDGHLWLWASGPDGRAGWVPDTLVADDADEPRAARGYSAIELSCKAGEVLEVMEETHGWAWCRSADGSEGWVPSRILRTVKDR